MEEFNITIAERLNLLTFLVKDQGEIVEPGDKFEVFLDGQLVATYCPQEDGLKICDNFGHLDQALIDGIADGILSHYL